MKVTYKTSALQHPLAVLRTAGYSAFVDPKTGEESFVLRLTSEYYPRFHLYVEEKGDEILFNLHLDQKKPSYGANHAHSGEYDGPTVEREMRRIDGWVTAEGRETTETVNAGEGGSLSTRPWWKFW